MSNNFKNINCDRFTGIHYPPSYSYGVSKRETCLITKAWFSKDINYCYRIENGSDQDNCIKLIAIISQSPEKCELLTSQKGYSSIESEVIETQKSKAWLYECYGLVAILGDNPNACQLIPFKSPEMLNKCISGANDGKNYLNKTHASFGTQNYTSYESYKDYLQ